MLRFACIALSLFAVCLAPFAHGETLDPRWAVYGPPLASLSEILFDPTNLNVAFVAGSNGVYRSADGGVTWNLSSGTLGLYAYDLAISPADPLKVYAATQGGLARSFDGGITFSLLEGATWFAVAVDPLDANTLYAVPQNGLGLSRSTDGGVTMTPADSGITGAVTPTALVVDPTNRSTLYLAMQNNAVWKSTDSGGSWSKVTTGLGSNAFLYGLAVDPSNPSTLYLATSSALYRSTNGAQSWALLPTGLANTSYRTVAISGSTIVSTTGLGVITSTNGGSSWTAQTSNNAMAAAVHPLDATLMLASSQQQMFRSSTTPPSFTLVGTGLKAGTIRLLTLDRNNPGTVLIATEAGLYKSLDYGGSWQKLEIGSGLVSGVEVDSGSPSILYAAVGLRITRSTDGGASFQPFAEGLPAQSSQALITVDPKNGGVLYCIANGMVYRRSGSNPWQNAHGALPVLGAMFLVIDPSTSTTLFVGTQSGEIYRTTNSGSSWVPLPQVPLAGALVRSLEIDPFDANHFVMKTSKSPMESKDGGLTWTTLSTFLAQTAIFFDPVIRGRMWARGDQRTLQRTNAAGGWEFVFNTDNRIDTSLARLSSDGRFLYTGGGTGGLWVLHFGKQRAVGR